MTLLRSLATLIAAASAAFTQTAAPVKACAALAPADAARIQSALNLCAPNHAVVLEAGDYVSAPLIIPRAVTLYLAEGATLRASLNPRDYDLAPNRCGEPRKTQAAVCKPFLYSYQAPYSGIAGPGVVDGQAGQPLTGLNRTWWDLARAGAAVPDLLSDYESEHFHVDGITLRNAAGAHAAIYKTPSLVITGLVADSPANSAAGPCLLLSNVAGGDVANLWIRVPAASVSLKSSILGATSRLRIHGVHLFGGKGIDAGDDGFGPVKDVQIDGVSFDGSPAFSSAPPAEVAVDLTSFARPGAVAHLTVAPDGSGDFRTVQSAIDALPTSGGDVAIKPGIYREVVTIRKPHVRLHGTNDDPAKTSIVFNNTAGNSGGTFGSATVFVEADDVAIDHMSLINDAGPGKGQAVALSVTADRAVFRNLRITGAQDTLFAASRYCYGDYGPCAPTRQYFADSYIEGNTDFIFGDSMAVFDHCVLHGLDTGSVMYTAQSRHTPEQKESGYIFDHCKLTGNPRTSGSVSLGRSWRPYATVIFLNTEIDAPVTPAGWTEWLRFGKSTLATATYAEYQSTGPGANPQSREPYSHQLTAAEAAQWNPKKFLAGWDGWNPWR